MIDLKAEYQLLKPILEEEIIQVLEKASYIKGEEVALFENNLAQYLKVKHVISCGNGTDALQIALMALGIGIGDEVIIPAFSYIAVIEVVCLLGATPVLVDVDADYFQINNLDLEKVITAKTKAIIPVHLFGQSGNLEELLQIAKKYNIPIIEDNAQALGAKYMLHNEEKFLGTFGAIGCTSFFPTKNLSCFGDGGALFTNDDELANTIRMIANHGQVKKYEHEMVGINSRLDTLQAVILNHKLNLLSKNLSIKQNIAIQYLNELVSLSFIQLPKVYQHNLHSWHQFTIKVPDHQRDKLKSFLKHKGIETMVYYPKTLNQQKAYTRFRVYCPISEDLCKGVLSLPIHPLLRKEDINYVSNSIKAFFHAKN
ncbi:DegT/DnrJ/EryC1/StrS family aminotransferase [Pedobacter cryophilus]|uniref:DegT/DnrJ/EryC1/StrS family aminotransferase n=2 Tax=Pedobacter cryophilus TaxID=2571271 RepID=A0A4U1C6Q4_9SPHI|nr:DegT/DnrJ/EryC1/StrS family aminotransferase [Pedobacter cryophilus]